MILRVALVLALIVDILVVLPVASGRYLLMGSTYTWSRHPRAPNLCTKMLNIPRPNDPQDGLQPAFSCWVAYFGPCRHFFRHQLCGDLGANLRQETAVSIFNRMHGVRVSGMFTLHVNNSFV